MIGKLKGLVEEIGEDYALIDVGGVCYVVFLSSRQLGQLPAIGTAISLQIETHVREDHIHLFGFASATEKRWFNVLCGVQGVGAKMAMGILSSFSPAEIAECIHARDSKRLTRANGVGPKLGERLVTELKGKIDKLPLSDGTPLPAHSGSIAPSTAQAMSKAAVAPLPTGLAPLEEATSALVNLGYGRSEAYRAVAEASGENSEMGLDGLIRESLKRLSR